MMASLEDYGQILFPSLDTEEKRVGGSSESYGDVCSADFQHRRPSYHPYARSLQIPRSDFLPLQHHHSHSVQQYQAQLAVIAQEVDPIEFAVWLLVLCQKMEVFYAIVKGKSRHGAFVHKKTATALCLTSMKKGNC